MIAHDVEHPGSSENRKPPADVQSAEHVTIKEWKIGSRVMGLPYSTTAIEREQLFVAARCQMSRSKLLVPRLDADSVPG